MVFLKIEALIHHINQCCTNNNLSKARSIIEHNWSLVTESKNCLLLNFIAQDLVKIIKNEYQNAPFNRLNLNEKQILNQMNQFVRDLRYFQAKQTYIKHKDLFNRSEIYNLLTADAKILCDSLISND